MGAVTSCGIARREDSAPLCTREHGHGRVHPKIRDFYERTHAYRLDTWATTHFPARLALWALVTTISRKVDQLNFPLDGLDTAYGMTSEIAERAMTPKVSWRGRRRPSTA